MLTLTKPQYFLPVHGEYKQLKKHALTAASLGIPTSNILIRGERLQRSALPR